MPLGWSMTLSRRVMAGVALGLTVILLLFGPVSRWTIHEATRAAYADRVELARMMASHVDHLLLSTLDLLQREAIGLGPALRQERITKVVRRVAKDLIANDETEISEVVRRRLFQDLGGEQLRRNVASAFADWCFERRA